MNKNLEIGMFILIGLLVGGGATYLLNPPEGYDTYICDNSTVGYCWKLSSTNKSCYWNESAPLRRKFCDSGWKIYKGEEITGTPVNLPDVIELNVSESDKILLAKKGIVSPEVSDCIRFSESKCKFTIKKGFDQAHFIDIYTEECSNIDNSTGDSICTDYLKTWKSEEDIQSEINVIYNAQIEKAIETERAREKTREDVNYNQSYGDAKIIEIK